jgi:hypothetical protein
MKTLGIITYPRTGSNWLGDILYGNNSLYMAELFCRDYLEFFRKISDLLVVSNIEDDIIKTFNQIYDRNNFWINREIHNNLSIFYRNKKIYSMDLLDAFKRQAYKLNKNFIFKFFFEHETTDIPLEKIIDSCDIIIVNYRKNLVHSYISLKKAIIDDQWSNTLDNNFKLLDTQVIWNKIEFLQYKYNIVSNLEKTINILNRKNKDYIKICYEDLHSLNLLDKKQYIQKILPNFILKDTETFLKQTFDPDAHIKSISNLDDYLNDIKLIDYEYNL